MLGLSWVTLERYSRCASPIEDVNEIEALTLAKVAEKLKTTMGIRDEWFLVHRVDLHSSLLRQAIGGANGRRAKLQLSCPVIDVVSMVLDLFLKSHS